MPTPPDIPGMVISVRIGDTIIALVEAINLNDEK
jgi:hypothetical protein